MKKLFFLLILSVCCANLICAQDTVRHYWSNKKLMSQGLEQNGVEVGNWVYFHKNGTKWMEGGYLNGQKVGFGKQ